MGERWMRWTFLEAITKTSSKILQKVVGRVSVTLAHAFFATMVIGVVQVITGFIVTRLQKKSLWGDTQGIVGACLFGFFAVIATTLAFTVFLLGGDIGVNTFIITLSIIPGALIDRFCFGHKLSNRKWVGVGVAVLAGYSVLGWPALSEVAKLPLWVWLSFGITFSVAINQGITQKVKKVDPFVKNFWGGLTTVVLCLASIFFLDSLHILGDFSLSMKKLIGVSLAVGIIVVGMWTFNLLSYKSGASIALKKLVMNGSYLTMAMIGGVVIFGENMTSGKIFGVLLYLVAFSLMDEKTWGFISKSFRSKPTGV